MESLDNLQKKVYNESDNYLIEYVSAVKSTVAIYFTSNNLFFPHTAEMFRSAVIEKDRYEWTRLKIKRAQKHIFVRDIYKQWYASGINMHINTMDKLIDWLHKETQGFSEIVCIGSSGGGYAATIVGTKLKASLIFNFNGQWDLYDNVVRNETVISPILKRLIDEPNDGVKYLNITNEEYDNNRIFYFVSIFSKWDKKQLNLIKNFNRVNVVRFCNNHHGIPFLKSTLPILLNLDYEHLVKLNKCIHFPICQTSHFTDFPGFWPIRFPTSSAMR